MMFKPPPLKLAGVFDKLKEIAKMSGHSSMNHKVGKIQGLYNEIKPFARMTLRCPFPPFNVIKPFARMSLSCPFSHPPVRPSRRVRRLRGPVFGPISGRKAPNRSRRAVRAPSSGSGMSKILRLKV